MSQEWCLIQDLTVMTPVPRPFFITPSFCWGLEDVPWWMMTCSTLWAFLWVQMLVNRSSKMVWRPIVHHPGDETPDGFRNAYWWTSMDPTTMSLGHLGQISWYHDISCISCWTYSTCSFLLQGCKSLSTGGQPTWLSCRITIGCYPTQWKVTATGHEWCNPPG